MSAKSFQRKDLKHDEFILGAGRLSHWLMERRRRIGWGLLAVALLVSVVLSVQLLRQRQEQSAAALLAAAMEIYRAPVVPPAPVPVATPVADGDADGTAEDASDTAGTADDAADAGGDTGAGTGGDTDGLVEDLAAAPAEDPLLSPEPQFTGLQFASESEKYLAAIARFEPIVERYEARPSGRLAAFYLGICQSELGNTEAAIVALTQAAGASEPLIAGMALYRLGQLELGVGNAEAAVEYFDRLLQLDGGFFPQEEALMAKARAQGDAGDRRAALATYQRVLRDYAGSYSEIEARTHVEEISAQLGLDPDVQSN